MRAKTTLLSLLGPLIFLTPGCSTSGIDTTYGKMRSVSLNGTGVFAGLLRARGHDVRTYLRLGRRIEEWADVIVRFAPLPGPPEKNEADWYDFWLNSAPNRLVVYVPHDFDATHEYWSRTLIELPTDASPRLIERVTEAKDRSVNWASNIGRMAPGTAPVDAWFKVETATGSATVHKSLEGPWSVGLDVAKVALPKRSTLKHENERVLLTADGKPVAMDWEYHTQSRVLVLTDGSYLLNEPLTIPARAELASRVADWISWHDVSEPNNRESGRTFPRHVAFVEGRFVTAAKVEEKKNDFRLETQLLLLGLVACLAAAPRLGRARPEPPSGADRPVAHPEALGALLARTGQAAEARGLLETYRRWRFRTGASTRSAPDKIKAETSASDRLNA